MKKRPKTNLSSPNQIEHPVDVYNLDAWVQQEIKKLDNFKISEVLYFVCQHIDDLVSWSKQATLLWDGCARVVKYPRYPDPIKAIAKEKKIALDGRINGPAVASFLLSGGLRPQRHGSTNAWSIHHIYSGKFPYLARESTLRAVRDPKHFTQSAGLVAVHPLADALCDEYPWFSWFLRAKAYIKFGYDPDKVFSSGEIDDHGFERDFAYNVVYSNN